jgi:hypothetical protein
MNVTSLTTIEQHQYAASGSMRLSRSAVILGVDVIAAISAVAWIWSGVWFGLLGFSFYHSRGDVWLPTPPAARDFFEAMLLTGTVLFGSLFVAISAVIFAVRRFSARSEESSGNFLTAAFYGDVRRLYVKYSAFLLSVLVSPYVYSYLRTFQFRRLLLLLDSRDGRMFRIYSGFAITFAALLIVIAVANLLMPRSARRADLETV